MGEVFFDITIILCIATAIAFVFKLFRQPPLLAYILTGIILGPLGVIDLSSGNILGSLSEIGIALLLFILGLELRLNELRSVGKIALTAGIGQIVCTAIAGYALSIALGFSQSASFYLALALTFSSTILIVKLLSDKKDLRSLHGKISIGMLLAQDFVAILALVFLSGVSSAGNGVGLFDFLLIGLKLIVIGGWTIVLSTFVFPKLIARMAHSNELLFLFSLAWAFGMAAFISSPLIGFSIEIGGFIAGLSLANSLGHYHIAAKVRPLRDFFITLFFVTMGMNMVFGHINTIMLPAVLLSLFVVIGSPLIVMILLGIMGHHRRTSFLSAISMAQVSEFSMILVFMGHKMGHIAAEVVAVVTIISVITFVVSTYMILNSNTIYAALSAYLQIFERKKKKKQVAEIELRQHVVLVGANRMGESVLEALMDKNHEVAVVDFDPTVIERLQSKSLLRVLYGDICDPEIQDTVGVDSAKLVISTIPSVEDNLVLLERLSRMNKEAVSIVFAMEIHDVRHLYDAGADYVVLPHLAGGRLVAKFIHTKEKVDFQKLREKDMEYVMSHI